VSRAPTPHTTVKFYHKTATSYLLKGADASVIGLHADAHH